ncbi:LysR family transcriptional regulator [Actinobacteria bacterium YIM 96077]|uniref:LysR family transcriptional regulator n=1 Tax=Phytoactinopolyspora halophila TaxID=1981511 RepID=A0A329QIB6_9ACTN|nr:LysR family transcriptional regulator [Phytoactinopolyspora halophila]AYY14446.1 LysR family transcriptional regulator [Actinobacteria bacterium YIM 96077]RAW11439.1 LysR family transcriptional regulator [Phytoactinopolyspora halophila]
MIDVSRLRLLRAVVATGSIRASASALGYTPSAVSQQLALLQRETGLSLLERSGRGIVPTGAARMLASEAEPLFEALNRVERVAGDLRAGRIGRLSIGYIASIGAVWLPSVVSVLHAEFPDLQLELRMTEAERGGIAQPVPDLDIFVEGPEPVRPDDVEVQRLVDDPYVAVVPGDHALASAASVPLAELAGERWVDNDLKDGACRWVLMSACAEAGFVPEFSVETHDYRTAIQFVAAGVGITVVPELAVGDVPDGLATVPVVSPVPTRHISVAVRRPVAEHPAVLRALELFRMKVTESR